MGLSFGAFAGGAARGITRGAALAEQAEDIKEKKRLRAAREAWGAIPDEPGFYQEEAMGPPTADGAIPMKNTSAVNWEQYKQQKLGAIKGFGDPMMEMQVRRELEDTERRMTINGMMEANSLMESGNAEAAAQKLRDTYKSYILPGQEVGEFEIKDGKIFAPGAKDPLDLGAVAMLATNDPQAYFNYVQKLREWGANRSDRAEDVAARNRQMDQTDRGLAQTDTRLGLEGQRVDIARTAAEDEARFRTGQLALLRQQGEERLARMDAKTRTAEVANIQKAVDNVASSKTGYLQNLTETDPAFAAQYGNEVAAVAESLAGVNPTLGGEQYLSMAEMLVRSRQPGGFDGFKERFPDYQQRWPDFFETAEDGNIEPLIRELTDENGTPIPGRYVMVNPVNGQKMYVNEELRRAFAAIGEADASADPTQPGPPTAIQLDETAPQISMPAAGATPPAEAAIPEEPPATTPDWAQPWRGFQQARDAAGALRQRRDDWFTMRDLQQKLRAGESFTSEDMQRMQGIPPDRLREYGFPEEIINGLVPR